MTEIVAQSDPNPTDPDGPWGDFDRYFDELSRRLNAAFGFGPAVAGPRAVAWRSPGTGVARAARTDIVDTGVGYRVTAEVPGIPKEKLEIRLVGPNVEIRSQDETKVDEAGGEFLHRERVLRGFYRAIELPEPVVADKATAKVVDGVLVLELPKQTPTPAPTEVRVPVQ